MSESVELLVWAVGSMAVLGLVFGVGLVLAARALGAEEDPMVEKIEDRLPGINCGACGYANCEQYARAVAEGEEVDLCVPGGQETAEALAELMGVEVGDVEPMKAVVHCQGGTDNCGSNRFEYVGERDCRAADITSGGPKDCLYGCLGFGSCAAECPDEAISMDWERRLPVIDPDACTGCGVCVKACPRDLISLIPKKYDMFLGCSSHDRGKAVKDICEVGCIACRLCVRKDPNEAIEMEDQLPVLDYEKGDGDFRVAHDVCPMDCFVIQHPERHAVSAGAEAEAQEA
ncbi:MAG: RnfABCDGE type electron transport complex subunit B [Planctomycetota bacterium]